MRSLITLFFCCAVFASSAVRAAECERPKLEGEAIAAAGGNSKGVFLIPLVLRFRPAHTNFGWELSAFAPYGVGGGFIMDAVRSESFRLHFMSLGVFFPMTDTFWIARKDVRRAYDLTVNIGVEIKIKKAGVFTADARVFLPDPVNVTLYYGGYAPPIYLDALRGGVIWLGYARRFYAR